MTRLPKSNFSQGRLELGPQRVELAFLEQFLTRLIRHVNNVTSKILLGVNKGLLDIQSTIGHGLKDVIEKPKPIRSFDMHQRAVGTIVIKKILGTTWLVGARYLCREQAQTDAKRGGSLNAPSSRNPICSICDALAGLRPSAPVMVNVSNTTLSARVKTSASTIFNLTALNAAAALASKPWRSQVHIITLTLPDVPIRRQLIKGDVADTSGEATSSRKPCTVSTPHSSSLSVTHSQ